MIQQQQVVHYNETPSGEEIAQEHTVLSFPARPGKTQLQPGENSEKVAPAPESLRSKDYFARAQQFAIQLALLEDRPFSRLTSNLEQDFFFI